MPVMGRSKMGNLFGNVKMAKPRQNNKISNQKVGEDLNRLAGNKHINAGGVKFVDRNKHNKMGKNEFLNLLAHQLSNQNPMDPMDQTKFSAELAQFSQLEQLSQLNSKFAKRDDLRSVQDKFYGASFLGKEIITRGTSIKHSGKKESVEIPFTMSKDAAKIIARVFDKDGQIVQQLNQNNVKKGSQSIYWDGMRSDGMVAEEGDYKIQVLAWDESNLLFHADVKTKGIVQGVTFENGETILMVDGKKVFLRDVDSFRMPQQKETEEQKIEIPPLKRNQVTSAYNEMTE